MNMLDGVHFCYRNLQATEFGKLSENRVLLNTSFNIRGLSILTTIVDALFVLDNTELDYVVIEGFLFSK